MLTISDVMFIHVRLVFSYSMSEYSTPFLVAPKGGVNITLHFFAGASSAALAAGLSVQRVMLCTYVYINSPMLLFQTLPRPPKVSLKKLLHSMGGELHTNCVC